MTPTEREQFDQMVTRLRDGGLGLAMLVGVVVGLVVTLAVLLPVTVMQLVALFLCWTGLPGLHWLGHAIRKHMTTPALDAMIGVPGRFEAWRARKPPV